MHFYQPLTDKQRVVNRDTSKNLATQKLLFLQVVKLDQYCEERRNNKTLIDRI